VLPAALLIGVAGSSLATSVGGLPLPEPGSYKLDRIQEVPFSIVREGTALPSLFSNYTKGKITLLAFFYAHCREPQGCPLAWNAFEVVREKIKADPKLHGQVRLVFFSFDRVNDVPETLQFFADTRKADADIAPWHFITAWTDYLLEQTLRKFGQDISVRTDSAGEQSIVIDHMLKVFLIDRDGWVREIYTTGYLDPDAIVGDMETLLLEEKQSNLDN
jgi:cytochrome oxidase Cu insertion factor (SCO1/SenC/PrrC family)